MRPRKTFLVLVLILAAGVALGAKISVEFDSAADFGAYATYAWKEGTPSSRRSIQNRIVQLVDRELQLRKFELTTADADFFVITHVLVDEHTLAELHDESYWEFVTGNTAINAMDLGAGSLVVDLLDADSEKIVWRGLVSGNVSGTVQKAEKRLDGVLAKLFKEFPPQ